MSQKYNWSTIHAPHLVEVVQNKYIAENFNTLLDILENKITEYDILNVMPLNQLAKKSSKIIGKLTGGNISIINESIGTDWELQSAGKILFLEDNETRPYALYRTLYHFKEIGKFKNVKAIVFGTCYANNCKNESINFLKKFASEINIPVYLTNQFGHGIYNKPLIYNANIKLYNNKMTIELPTELQHSLGHSRK